MRNFFASLYARMHGSKKDGPRREAGVTSLRLIPGDATSPGRHPVFTTGSIFLSCLIFFAGSAFAAKWHVDPATSRLMFEGEQSGEKFSGSFPKFTSEIDFDEAVPQKGKINITVDMASVQVDGSDRLEALPTDEWFSVKQFPVASFNATSIRATGSDKPGINHYEAKGLLTIRGATRNVTLPFSLKTTGTSTVARGELTLSRYDFGIGQGRWLSDEYVKHPVKVTFELHASKQ